MTLITPEDRTSLTAELLQSFQESLRDLRQQAEALRRRLKDGEDADLVDGSRRIAAAEALVRSCQKVEISLVEQQNRQAGIVQGGYALDLAEARIEVRCRLDRLRTHCGAPVVPG